MASPKLKPVDGKKYCHVCKQWKPIEKFRSRGKTRRRSSPCTACLNAKTKATRSEAHKRWRVKQGPTFYVAQALKARYGLTIEQWMQMFAQQKGRCAVCKTAFDLESSKKEDRPVVDHCHVTKAVRGLLCRSCNSGLGMFRDSPDILRAAAKYLQRNRVDVAVTQHQPEPSLPDSCPVSADPQVTATQIIH